MRNCVILGTGRSGTSMVAGALARSGYHLGQDLFAARAANPKGFFEAPAVNGINDRLLEPMLPPTPALADGQRWLGIPVPGAQAQADPATAAQQAELVAAGPWCYKDPRFCFTLEAWRPHLGDAGLVCVFRHPALTATSMVRECASAAYLAGVEIDLAHAYRLWIQAYRRILDDLSADGDWLFLHYDQALTAEGQERLATFLEAPVDGAFPDPKLRRDLPEVEVPDEALELYAELCRRAAHRPEDTPQSNRPRVCLVAFLGEGEGAAAAELLADARDQRGVEVDLLLIDETADGVEIEGATVVPAPSWSRGVCLRAAAEHTDAPYVALAAPGCRSLPSRLAHAVADLEAQGSDLVTADYVLTDAAGTFVDRSNPSVMGEAPGPYFAAGVVLRREVLAEVSPLAFFPVVLDLVRRLGDQGRTGHSVEPGFSVDRERFERAWEITRHDAALVTLQDRPYEAPGPELTVSLCTYNRRETLRECLAGFSRQLLAPGTFEIVLVDDGSSDGTAEALEGLQLPVPVRHVAQPNGGLSAARNTGLELARGRLVLFVNDDTIAFPDLVERHLEAHRGAGGEKTCVLGSFEQPAEALDNALLRYLEGSGEVFGYAEMVAGERYDAMRFYTCNVSVPLADVRAVGGYDESFRHYGCEDTDLALRLEALGHRVLYEPRARALHRHAMDFAYVQRRARTVARAYVRLMRKHPDVLERWNNRSLSIASCREDLDRAGPRLAILEEAVAELARIDVGALERLGGPYAEAAAAVLESLGELFGEVNALWWRQGYIEGMQEHGLWTMAELTEDGDEPWPVASDAPLRLFAWPRWDQPASLDALFERAAELVGPGPRVALVLRYDAGLDPPREEALAALEAAYGRRFADGEELEVVLEEAPLGDGAFHRLGRAVQGFLPLGGEPAAFLQRLGSEPLADAKAVRRWRARYQAPPPPPALPRGPKRPELSVIVPTRDRPRELAHLIGCLAHQDLERSHFEVIVVDDGSAVPAQSVLEPLQAPFDLRVLRREAAGPAAARNAALALARGETIVFFNDDAVPALDCLRRHLEAHRFAARPTAVLGTFQLLPRHRRDSVSEVIETSTTLFAQPAMRAGVRYHGLALCTGNVSLPKEALDAVGGFDEAFPAPGGEDSELGLRLERELGLRVLFDPRIRCGHDHAMNAVHLARRKRGIGWAAYHMQVKHGELGLLPAPWPISDGDWDALEQRLAAEASGARGLAHSLTELAAREVAERRGATAVERVRNLLPRVEEHEMWTGALLAHRGRGLDETLDAVADDVAAVASEE